MTAAEGDAMPAEEASGRNGNVAPTQRVDPARSACVLIGVDEYRHLAPLPGVANNLTSLFEVLRDESVWGIPKGRCTVLRNPRNQWEITEAIEKAAEAAEDTLLVYYAGHGLLDMHDGELYLTLPVSQPNRPARALQYELVRRTLVRSRQAVRRSVLVLDCCYSGRALGEMSAADVVTGDIIAIEGSYVLTSTPSNQLALAPRGEKYTAFTGELIKVLREGCAGLAQQPMLTLNELHQELVRAMRARKLPVPQRADTNGVGDLPFIRNPRLSKAGPVQVTARLWTRSRSLIALSLASVLVVSSFAAGDWYGKRDARLTVEETSAPGPCGNDDVILQDTSAALDGKELNGEQIKGLSALALSGRSAGYVLGDDDPGRVYPISLGDSDSLAPSIDRVRYLHRKDGTAYPRHFDGEGLVLERGGKTILVSSEAPPAVRRFDLATGNELGEIELPRAFHLPPVGEAALSRNVESLTATADGRFLFVGLEATLATDDDIHGKQALRIQRYRGNAGGAYHPDHQYAYEADEGLFLTELVALDQDHLLALERGGMAGKGNTIHVYRVNLDGADDVSGKSIGEGTDEGYGHLKMPLFDLADCPQRRPEAEGHRSEGIVENTEGMALAPAPPGEPHPKRRVLYLVSDDNGAVDRSTRVYRFSVRLP
ncbi:caspase, EACC1-associated type [Streptomyces odontomachi]|uniref:caspase, EACC1-associated type n=1 Tax=Streptomyces odontomachi TaxID=2944940 RepID=UPI00210C3F21|nr:esterase-like activity of phytase family protein [Streptomyces sp. ODS25]